MSPRIASQLRNSARVEQSRWHAYYQQKQLCADGESYNRHRTPCRNALALLSD